MKKLILCALCAATFGCPPKVSEDDAAVNALLRQNGTVVNSEGNEVAYDLKSGKDCFSLFYSDDFDYPDLNALLTAKLPGQETAAWFAQTDWNNHPDGVTVGGGNVSLWVERVDDPEHPVVKENRRIAKTLCGGITFNEKVLYGYLEASVKMNKKERSLYWPGFYTEGREENAEGKAVAGYEFDIFEPLDNKEIDQTTHWTALLPGKRLASHRHGLPLTFDRYIKVAVAWTPEKVAYYVDDKLSYVLYNDNRNNFLSAAKVHDIQTGSKYKKDIAEPNKYQIVANIPQTVILVVAATNSSDGWGLVGTGAGLPSAETAPDGWKQEVYKYDYFKYYRYVGTEK